MLKLYARVRNLFAAGRRITDFYLHCRLTAANETNRVFFYSLKSENQLIECKILGVFGPCKVNAFFLRSTVSQV